MFNEFANIDFDESMANNIDNYMIWYERLKLLALSVYKWENLPDSCNERFIENELYLKGKVGFFEHQDYGLVNSNITADGKLNQYNEPVQYMLDSVVWHEKRPFDEAVLCRNNAQCIPTGVFVKHFANRLKTIQEAIDTNVDLQKFTTMILCDEKERLTFKNLIAQYQGGSPFVYGSKYLNMSQIQPLPVNAPFIAKDLYPMLHEVYNDALKFLGIKSFTSGDKSQTILTPELEATQEVVDMSRMQGLMYRQKAAEEVNKMFGTNISVTLRDQKEYALGAEYGMEVNDNGEVHD